ncbi:alpha/beta fold hydrolase [soil metagenome]
MLELAPPPGQPAGSRLVFLHGLFGQGRNWNTLGRQLSATHRVSLVDLPNHGRSAWTDHIDYLDMADQVAELVSTDDPVTVVGHSMGGKVAMVLALRHPGLVARLVVVDMSPVGYDNLREFTGYVDALASIDLAKITRRTDAEAQLAARVDSPSIRSFLLQNLTHDAAGWAWRANLDVLGRDLGVIGGWPAEQVKDLAPYDGPVLWVAGERSSYIRPEYAEAMARYFPKYRKVTIKNASHWVHSDQPEVFADVLRQFIS